METPRQSQHAPRPSHPGGAVREETEITGRLATADELRTLGYSGDVVVTQVLRTTFRADGTPVGKTLTIQGGSTPVVLHGDPKDLDPDE